MKKQLSYMLSIRHFLKFGVHGDKQLTFMRLLLGKIESLSVGNTWQRTNEQCSFVPFWRFLTGMTKL